MIRVGRWSLHCCAWHTHPRSCLRRYAQAQSKSDPHFWVLIICLLLHPTWKREKEGTRQGPNVRQAVLIFFRISLFIFLSLLLSLYISKWILLPAWDVAQPTVTHILTEMIKCHQRQYLWRGPLTWQTNVTCSYHVNGLWGNCKDSSSNCFHFLSNHSPLFLLLWVKQNRFPGPSDVDWAQ